MATKNDARKVQTRVCPVCNTVHDLPLCGERKPAETSEETKERDSASTPLIAFGGWRCDCSILAEDFSQIPDFCPKHNVGLLGPRSWEQNPNNVPLGITDGAITRRLVKELRS